METPKFKNRKEQLMWYVRNSAIPLANEILTLTGENELPETILNSVPDTVLIAQIVELKERFGEDLENRNVNVVFQICVMYSHCATVKGITEKAQKLVDLLNQDKTICDKLFGTWKILNKLIT